MLNPPSPIINTEVGNGSPTPPRPVEGLRDAFGSPAALVPDYELLRRVGGGSYGEVWLARSKATGALRAAKIVWRHRFEDERPFQREFEGIQRFERISREHPSQLALFHIGRNEAEGYFYYVMELADDLARRGDGVLKSRSDANGQRPQHSNSPALQNPAAYVSHTLRADLAQGRLPAARVLEIGLALAEALSHLHRNGLVHRDVKPANVIFVSGRPKLADIGLVTDASDQCSIVGTEGYLPPEGPGTPQADIFALGKVLYEAATGMDRQKFPQLPPEIHAWPDAAQVFELNEILLRACAANPDQRYASAEAMLEELTLLKAGKSVRSKRILQWCYALGKRTGLVLSAAAVIAGLVYLLPRQFGRSELSTDGPDSTNPQAKALCAKAMNILRYDGVAEFANAYTNFNQAIALDPHFARPYVGLLELNAREHVPGMPPATREVMLDIAHHLERLAPRLAATHVARGIVNWSDWKYPEAEQCMLEAIRANPNYELAHTWYSWLLECYGRPKEAYRQLVIASNLAPSKVTIYRGFGNNCLVQRDYTNAIARYKETLRWEPGHVVAWNGIGEALLAMGDYTNALGYFEKAEVLFGANETATKERYKSLRRALDDGGIPAYWQLQLKWAESDTNATFYDKAVLQMHLGKTNAALDLLRQSYDTRERGANYETPLNDLLRDDCWDGVHDDPRFQKLLDDIGYTQVMRPRPQ